MNSDSQSPQRLNVVAKGVKRELVQVQRLSDKGEGIATLADGCVLFVTGTCPGDVASVQVVQKKKRYARGELLQLHVASPGRVTPLCPQFLGNCGGCQTQHIRQDVQRRNKQTSVEYLLKNWITQKTKVDDICGVGLSRGWRYRARLAWFRPSGTKRAVLGFKQSKSHRVYDLSFCQQLTPALNTAIQFLREECTSSLHGRGAIRLLAGEGVVAVSVNGACDESLLEKLEKHFQGGNVNGKGFGQNLVSYGSGFASVDGFAQPSPEGEGLLLQTAESHLPTECGDTLDLFCGRGNFSRILKGRSRTLNAVDMASGWDLEEGEAIRHVGRVEEVMKKLSQGGKRFQTVLLDPPRQGAPGVLAQIAAMEAQEIVYVSCNPRTLARDLQELGSAYQLKRVSVIDLMPDTVHTEVIVSLDRA